MVLVGFRGVSKLARFFESKARVDHQEVIAGNMSLGPWKGKHGCCWETFESFLILLWLSG